MIHSIPPNMTIVYCGWAFIGLVAITMLVGFGYEIYKEARKS